MCGAAKTQPLDTVLRNFFFYLGGTDMKKGKKNASSTLSFVSFVSTSPHAFVDASRISSLMAPQYIVYPLSAKRKLKKV